MPEAIPTVAQIADRVTRVPDSARQFTQAEDKLHRIFRIDRDLLSELLDAGLPHRYVAGQRQYDFLDLANIGIALRLPCPHWAAMKWWSKSLSQEPSAEKNNYEIIVSAECPEPDHAGDCEFEIAPKPNSGAFPGHMRERHAGVYALRVCLPSCMWHFGYPFDLLIEQILPVRFHLLPRSMGADLGFLNASGLADCRSATQRLVEWGGELGVPVRKASGYFVLAPYPVWHNWVEFLVADQWVAADPFLLNTFARWGIVDAGQWPPNRSPGGRLLRISGGGYTIWHGDTPLKPALTIAEGRRT